MDCIFGIFDVLGFTSFCENCDSNNAEKVLKIMDDFETDIPKMVWANLDANNKAPQEKKEIVTSRLRWLVFSDTVFVALPIELSADPDTLKFNLIFFTILVAWINRRMFEIGLPVRGAVHIGDVTISKRCFAGKSIVDAYKLGKRVQVAGTIISEQARAFIFNTFPNPTGFNQMFRNLIIECDVSTGKNTSEKLKTLCWFYLQMGLNERFNIHMNLNRFIREKFTAHGKKLLGQKEKNKVFNTEKLFTEWKIANFLDYQRSISPKTS